MAKMNIKLEIQNTDKVKTLLELLREHINDLPADLVKSIKEVADCEACELGNDYFSRATRGYEMDLQFIFDGYEVERGIVSVNKILKRVTMYDDYDGGSLTSLREAHVFPESFSAVAGGKTIVSW